MIRDLLTRIDKGSIILSQLARESGMTEADLKNRLEVMVYMGHLEAVPVAGHSMDAGDDCPGCLMAAQCQQDICSGGTIVVGYRLTDKGRRMARGTEGRP